MGGFVKLGRVKATSLNICKFILFFWMYVFGMIKKIINDNGTSVAGKLNKVFCFVMGAQVGRMMEYSPWSNGAEAKMRGLNMSLSVNKCAADRFELGAVYEKLVGIYKHKKECNYADILPSIEFAHNNSVKRATGYSPN